MGGDD
jgi:hypothetical protein